MFSAEAIPSIGTSVDAVAYWHDQFWAISEGDAAAPVWTSSDGRVWAAQSSPTLVPSLSAKKSPYQLVADQLGLIAYTSGGAAFSPDGRSWQTTDLHGDVSAITRSGSQLVALVDVPVAQSSGRAVVFTSSDGLHWTRGTELGARVDPGSITVTTWNGELWAVSYPSNSQKASLVWHSADGVSWSHPDVPYSPPGTVFDQLVPIGRYLVATGFDTNSRPGGWVTTDGSHWIPMPDLGRPPGGRLDVATSDGSAVVAMSSSGLDDFYRWTVPTPTTPVATSPVTGPALPPAGSAPAVRTVNRPSLGLATAYQLTGPIGVAADERGDLYFTDGNRVLQVDHATHRISVVAGTGKNGFSGDGGSALRARLSYPSGVAVAPNGDVYFVDNDRIRKVSATTGTIATVAGDGHIGDAGDGGLAVRASLNLDSPASGSVGLNEPLAIGPNGDLFIADSANYEIRKVSHVSGVIVVVAGNGHAGPRGDGGIATRAELCAPLGVAVDRSANIFIATACGAIREVSGNTGSISTIFSMRQDPALAGTGGDHDPVGLAVGDNGKLYVTEAYGRRLLEIELRTGAVSRIAGNGNETIQRPHGDSGDGGPASKATFGLAMGVSVDQQGDIYVADFFNNAIRKIDARTGVINTVAGQIPTTPVHCC